MAKIGFIIYMMIKISVDIIFTVSIVSCFSKYLGSDNFNIVDQILRYLAYSTEKDIIFMGKSKLNFVRYLDFNLVRNYFDRKLISRFVFTFNSGSISYCLKKQVVVILSSTKAEYLALGLARRETI